MSASEDPARRWRRLVRTKFAEMERLSPEADRIGPTFWDTRAERYAQRVAGTAERDPFVRRARRHIGRRTVVLDVGAGTGRITVALAPRAREVVAIDPSAGMLEVLARDAERAGLTNVRTLQAPWEESGDVVGDVAVCAYVLPIIEDVAPFLRKLDRAARRRVLISMAGASTDLLFDPIWRHFHGQPRAPGPTYLDAVAVLATLGVTADVDIVEVPARSRFPDLDEAVADYRRSLCLPDTAEARAELRPLLDDWLVQRGDGLGAPVRSLPAAVVSWTPQGPSGDGTVT